MPTDRLIQQCALILVNLREFNIRILGYVGWIKQTFGRTDAISWLPVTDNAKSTIIALRPL
jgi:hypothetical protein